MAGKKYPDDIYGDSIGTTDGALLLGIYQQLYRIADAVEELVKLAQARKGK